jgi:hypothetical protein
MPGASGYDASTYSDTLEIGVPKKAVRLPLYLTKGYRTAENFFGRQDVLGQIDDALLNSNNQATTKTSELRSVALCGMGGVGKTEVAIKYVSSRTAHFDAIFWLTADTKEKLAAGFSEIARELGLEDKSDAHDDVASREIVKEWLCKPAKGPHTTEEAAWLLVFDNADDPDILCDYWPQMGTGAVLVTSRDPFAKNSLYSPAVGIDVQPFAVADAAVFLQMISMRQSEPASLDTCAQIAQSLGGLPLAIAQMGGIIRRRSLSLQEFMEYYKEDAGRLQNAHSQHIRSTYAHTVSTVFAIERIPPAAAALLQVLSLLDPDAIPERILTNGAISVKLESYPKTKADYFEARAELIRSSLITRHIDENEIRIHRLVQDVVRQKMPAGGLQIVFDDTINLLSAVWPFASLNKATETARWKECEQIFPHLARLKQLFEDQIRGGDTKAGVAFAAVFNEAGW